MRRWIDGVCAIQEPSAWIEYSTLGEWVWWPNIESGTHTWLFQPSLVWTANGSRIYSTGKNGTSCHNHRMRWGCFVGSHEEECNLWRRLHSRLAKRLFAETYIKDWRDFWPSWYSSEAVWSGQGHLKQQFPFACLLESLQICGCSPVTAPEML